MNEMSFYMAIGAAGAVLYLIAGLALAVAADNRLPSAFKRVMPDQSVLLALAYWLVWPAVLSLIVLVHFYAVAIDDALG